VPRAAPDRGGKAGGPCAAGFFMIETGFAVAGPREKSGAGCRIFRQRQNEPGQPRVRWTAR
jgi:hypothetical protein